jgi:hypothetical protein
MEQQNWCQPPWGKARSTVVTTQMLTEPADHQYVCSVQVLQQFLYFQRMWKYKDSSS